MIRKSKNQKGAISLFVLLSMLFFLAFMMGAYAFISRRSTSQIESLKETQAIYNSGLSASDIYDSILVGTDAVIPISNKEQLIRISQIEDTTTEASYIINDKLYTYKDGANYVLQNDIILDLKSEINGKNNINIYDYLLYSDKYNIDANGHNVYYSNTDGSVWKCISYQNIGVSESKNLFSNIEGNTNYYGKSYTSKLYSILENGIDNYKKAWDENTNFEFMLMYNCYEGNFDSTKYNRWRQTNNPKDETALNDDNEAKEKVTGFVSVTEDGLGTDNYFGGLIKATTASYLKAIVGETNYPIALTSVTNNQINVVDNNTATEYLLFVRVK